MTMRSIATRLDKLEQKLQGKRGLPRYIATMYSSASDEVNAAALRRAGFEPDSADLHLIVVHFKSVSPDPEVPDKPLYPVPELTIRDNLTQRQVWPT